MASFSISVKQFNADTYKVDVTPATTVDQLKHMISEKSKVPVDEMKLIYKGRILKANDEKMSDLSVIPDSVLHMTQQKKSAEPEKGKDVFSNVTTTPTPGTTPNQPQNPLGNLGGMDFGDLEGMGDLGGMGGMGGLGGMGGMGGMNPAQIQGMLQNPQVRQGIQNLMQNPEMMRNMIQNNPMLRNMAQSNPMMQQMLNDPQMMSNMMNMMMNGGGPFGASLGNPAPGQTPANPTSQGVPNLNLNPNPAPGANANAPQPNFNFANLLNNPAFGAPDSNLKPEDKYKEQLAKLNEMGFTNKDLNIQVLNQCMGNVDLAVEKLLSLFK